jgi:F0F1-type ATP synthase assembly protein I
MGATTAGCVAAGTGLGIYGDHVLNSSPACTLAGLGVGVVMAVGAVYAQIRKFF